MKIKHLAPILLSAQALVACGNQDVVRTGELEPIIGFDFEYDIEERNDVQPQQQYSTAVRGSQVELEAAPDIDREGIVLPHTTVANVLEAQDGASAEFLDESIAVESKSAYSVELAPQTTLVQAVEDNDEPQQVTETTEAPAPAVRVAASPSDQGSGLTESYLAESEPASTGGITQINGPATVGKPAERIGVADGISVDSMGADPVRQEDITSIECNISKLTVPGLIERELSISLRNLIPDPTPFDTTDAIGEVVLVEYWDKFDNLTQSAFYKFYTYADEIGNVEESQSYPYPDRLYNGRLDGVIKLTSYQGIDPNAFQRNIIGSSTVDVDIRCNE